MYSINFKDYKQYLHFGNKMISKEEARANPQYARSIASYLNGKELTDDDRTWIANITKPKGWRAEFNEIENLSAEEILERSQILNRIKKYPPLKVYFSFQIFQNITIFLVSSLCPPKNYA